MLHAGSSERLFDSSENDPHVALGLRAYWSNDPVSSGLRFKSPRIGRFLRRRGLVSGRIGRHAMSRWNPQGQAEDQYDRQGEHVLQESPDESHGFSLMAVEPRIA